MKRSRGFTRIELLIVVSIIALLIAILLPALGKARRSAFKVDNQSNIRQWYNTSQWEMYYKSRDGF